MSVDHRDENLSKVEDENNNLNKSNHNVRIHPLKSRLSFTDVELKNLSNLTKWSPYESAHYEQPFCFSFFGPAFFKIRWFYLSLFRVRIPFTSLLFGKVLFFLLFLIVAAGLGYLVWGELESSGFLACLFLGLTFAFPTKNSIWLAIAGIPFERALFWHKYVAVISVGMGIYHGIVADKIDISGIVLVALMGLITVFSFYKIRRNFFECFLRFHWIIFLLIMPIALIHGAGVALIGAVIWLLDSFIRYCLVKKNQKKVEIVEITQIPPSLVKICFENSNFHYKAGQYVFVCVPEISIWEWHPISLSSCPNEKAVSLHVRVLGDWTKKLYDLSGRENATTKVWFDGPYGNCTLNIDSDEYELFLLISGGIGITPLQSICNQLVYEHLRGRKIKKIFFIWSVKDKFLYQTVSDNTDAFYLKNLPITNKLPFAFQPNVLIKHEHEQVLNSFFHLTSVRNESEYYKGNINPQEQKLLRFGRPNLPSYFEKMKQVAKDNNLTKVAVLCCGPEGLIDECTKLTRNFSGGGVSFRIHEETFNF